MSTAVTIPTHSTPLKALLDVPDATGLRAGVLLCHSWPGLGGSMTEPVLQALAAALLQAQCAVLRIQFRSAGRRWLPRRPRRS